MLAQFIRQGAQHTATAFGLDHSDTLEFEMHGEESALSKASASLTLNPEVLKLLQGRMEEVAQVASLPYSKERAKKNWEKLRVAYRKQLLGKKAAERNQPLLSKYLLSPEHKVRVWWNLFLAVLILYGAIAVPFRIGFEVQMDEITAAVDVCFDGLFLIDVCMNFVTMYRDERDVWVTDHSKIAKHYFRTWFFVDFLSSVPIDAMMNVAISWWLAASQSARFLRLFRLVRLLKLARLVKLGKLLKIDINPALLRLVKVLMQIALASHLLACAWHFQSTFDVTTQGSWLARYGVRDADVYTRYTCALYWTVATMTAVGYGDIVADTLAERVFSIVTMLLGASMFGFIIGNITKLLDSVNLQSTAYARKITEMKHYLRDRGLQGPIAKDTLKFFKYYYRRTCVFDTASLLSGVPEEARAAVILSGAIGQQLPPLRALCRQTPRCLASLALNMRPLLSATRDTLLHCGDVGTQILFLVSGRVQAVQPLVLRNGESISLPVALFTAANHFGGISVLGDVRRRHSYEAASRCELLAIRKEDLLPVLMRQAGLRKAMRLTAARRVSMYSRSLDSVKLLLPSPISRKGVTGEQGDSAVDESLLESSARGEEGEEEAGSGKGGSQKDKGKGGRRKLAARKVRGKGQKLLKRLSSGTSVGSGSGGGQGEEKKGGDSPSNKQQQKKSRSRRSSRGNSSRPEEDTGSSGGGAGGAMALPGCAQDSKADDAEPLSAANSPTYSPSLASAANSPTLPPPLLVPSGAGEGFAPGSAPASGASSPTPQGEGGFSHQDSGIVEAAAAAALAPLPPPTSVHAVLREGAAAGEVALAWSVPYLVVDDALCPSHLAPLELLLPQSQEYVEELLPAPLAASRLAAMAAQEAEWRRQEEEEAEAAATAMKLAAAGTVLPPGGVPTSPGAAATTAAPGTTVATGADGAGNSDATAGAPAAGEGGSGRAYVVTEGESGRGGVPTPAAAAAAAAAGRRGSRSSMSPKSPSGLAAAAAAAAAGDGSPSGRTGLVGRRRQRKRSMQIAKQQRASSTYRAGKRQRQMERRRQGRFSGAPITTLATAGGGGSGRGSGNKVAPAAAIHDRTFAPEPGDGSGGAGSGSTAVVPSLLDPEAELRDFYASEAAAARTVRMLAGADAYIGNGPALNQPDTGFDLGEGLGDLPPPPSTVIGQGNGGAAVEGPEQVMGNGALPGFGVGSTASAANNANVVDESVSQAGRTRAEVEDAVAANMARSAAGGIGGPAGGGGVAGGEEDDDDATLSMQARRLLRRGLIHPQGPLRIKWDVAMAVAVLYSVVVTPYRICFDRPALGGWMAFETVVDCAFGVDILLNFRTAYYGGRTGTVLITHPRLIGHRYLRGWFTVDMLATLPLDALAAFRTLRIIRVLRLLRLLKMARLLKLGRFVKHLEDVVFLSPATIKGAKLLCEVSFIAHLMCCFWVFMTSSALTGGDSFPDEPHYARSSVEYHNWWRQLGLSETDSTAEFYIASLYWAVATMTTVGYGDAAASTNTERVYASVCMVLGATVFGYIVGSIATLLGNLDVSASLRMERLTQLQEYLVDTCVPRQLQFKILRASRNHLLRSSAFREASFFRLMPEHLRKQVISEIYFEILKPMSFLGDLRFGKRDIILHLLPLMTPQYAGLGEVVIHEGDTSGSCMYLVTSGVLLAVAQAGTRRQKILKLLEAGGFFGELCLLGGGVPRLATVRADTASELLLLTRDSLQHLQFMYPAVGNRIINYLKKHIRRHVKRTAPHLVPSLFPPEPQLASANNDPRFTQVYASGRTGTGATAAPPAVGPCVPPTPLSAAIASSSTRGEARGADGGGAGSAGRKGLVVKPPPPISTAPAPAASAAASAPAPANPSAASVDLRPRALPPVRAPGSGSPHGARFQPMEQVGEKE